MEVLNTSLDDLKATSKEYQEALASMQEKRKAQLKEILARQLKGGKISTVDGQILKILTENMEFLPRCDEVAKLFESTSSDSLEDLKAQLKALALEEMSPVHKQEILTELQPKDIQQ
jgi:hypothetical protein